MNEDVVVHDDLLPIILNASRDAQGHWYCTGTLPPDGTYVVAQEVPGNGRILQETGWLLRYDAFPGAGKSAPGTFMITGRRGPEDPPVIEKTRRWEQIRS